MLLFHFFFFNQHLLSEVLVYVKKYKNVLSERAKSVATFRVWVFWNIPDTGLRAQVIVVPAGHKSIVLFTLNTHTYTHTHTYAGKPEGFRTYSFLCGEEIWVIPQRQFQFSSLRETIT